MDDMPTIKTGRGKHLNVSDIEKIRVVLEGELTKNEPPYYNLVEIAKQLGCSFGTLRNHCPELCSAITARRSKNLVPDELEKLRKGLEDMLLMENPPTLTTAALTLGYSADVLRKHFPDSTRELVARNQESFSYVNVQKHLLEVLADNSEPFPSLQATARSLGCSVSIIQTRCPDLCREIAERYKEYLHRRHEARIAMLCEEVRQAVLRLHQQGIYPNARQVSVYLSNSKLMLTIEVHEFWQNILIELGWKQ